MGENSTSINSAMLQLQTLQLQFVNVLAQYKQAYATYISDLQSTPSFVVIPGKTFWGSSSVIQSSSTSTSNCTALCSANPKCSGATFNSSTQLCSLRGGTGMVGPGTSVESAIITQTNADAETVQALNLQLTSLNEEMNTLLMSTETTLGQETISKNIQKEQLASIYSSLVSERQKIAKMNQDYQNTTQQYNDNSLITNTANTYYLIWTLITIIIVLITVKYLFFPAIKPPIIKTGFWLVIGCLFVVLTSNMQMQTAYGLWLLLIAILILMYFKLLPLSFPK